MANEYNWRPYGGKPHAGRPHGGRRIEAVNPEEIRRQYAGYQDLAVALYEAETAALREIYRAKTTWGVGEMFAVAGAVQMQHARIRRAALEAYSWITWGRLVDFSH